MPFTDEDKALVVAFSDWLATKKEFDSTSLEIVQQTMAEAVGLDLHVPTAASIRPFSLLDVFNAGRQALEKQRGEFESKVLPKLVESNFFASAQAGTAEHDALLAHARMKFFARESSSKSATAPAAAPAETTPAAAAPSPVDFARAEVHKTEGNQHLSAGRHQQAVEAYSKAIHVNSQNNIYFANRALANIELQQFAAALEDCDASLKLDAGYSKAHYRRGLSLMGLQRHSEAVEAFESALEHNTGDDTHVRAKLAQAKQKANGTGSDVTAAAANPFAALSGLGGMPGMGGMPDLGGMDFGALMNNPAIAQMAQQFMSDPNMMNNLGAMFGGMGGGMGAPAAAAASAPAPVASESKPKESKAKAASNPMDQLTQLINSPEGQEMMLDPVMGPVMVDIQANGPMAAMKHIGNPAVMQKIQALMAKKK